MKRSSVAQHSIGTSLTLHLLPGVLIGACYYALVPVVGAWGYPSIVALMLAVGLVLVPIELGYLVWVARRKGRRSLWSAVSYRVTLPLWQYFLWVPLLFVLLGLVFTFMRPIDAVLREGVFSGLPALQSGLQGQYSRGVLIRTYAMVAVFGATIGPIVEELYFRGFLLPRMGYAGRWAPLVHSFLFALYHIWTPWMAITRTVGMLPLVYAARRRSLYLSIGVHVLVNMVDVVAGAVFILGMSSAA